MLLPLYSPFLFPSLCPNLQGQGQRGKGTGVHSRGHRDTESPKTGSGLRDRGRRKRTVQ